MELQEVPNRASTPLSGIFAIEPTREVSTPSSHPGRMPQINPETTSMTSREPSRSPRSRSISPSRTSRVFVRFGCFQEGHLLMDFPFLSAEKRKIFQDAQQRQLAARMLWNRPQRAPQSGRGASVPRRTSPVREINFEETPAAEEPTVPKTILKN